MKQCIVTIGDIYDVAGQGLIGVKEYRVVPQHKHGGYITVDIATSIAGGKYSINSVKGSWNIGLREFRDMLYSGKAKLVFRSSMSGSGIAGIYKDTVVLKDRQGYFVNNYEIGGGQRYQTLEAIKRRITAWVKKAYGDGHYGGPADQHWRPASIDLSLLK